MTEVTPRERVRAAIEMGFGHIYVSESVLDNSPSTALELIAETLAQHGCSHLQIGIDVPSLEICTMPKGHPGDHWQRHTPEIDGIPFRHNGRNSGGLLL